MGSIKESWLDENYETVLYCVIPVVPHKAVAEVSKIENL